MNRDLAGTAARLSKFFLAAGFLAIAAVCTLGCPTSPTTCAEPTRDLGYVASSSVCTSNAKAQGCSSGKFNDKSGFCEGCSCK